MAKGPAWLQSFPHVFHSKEGRLEGLVDVVRCLDALRPWSLKNTVSKAVAALVNTQIRKVAECRCHGMPRAFLKDRQYTSHIVALDAAARRAWHHEKADDRCPCFEVEVDGSGIRRR